VLPVGSVYTKIKWNAVVKTAGIKLDQWGDRNMAKAVQEKVVIVTGAGGGIGCEIAGRPDDERRDL
jgi:FlaA1/EpsC-like NDP-sugar epimerase